MIVEKDATFQSLINQGFCCAYPDCLLITGKGYPDVATRELVVKLAQLDIKEIQTLAQKVPGPADDMADFWNDSDYVPREEELDLTETDFWDDAPIIVKTSKPSEEIPSTYWQDPVIALKTGFLQATDYTEKMKGFVLTDCDSDGVEIMLNFRNGSIVN